MINISVILSKRSKTLDKRQRKGVIRGLKIAGLILANEASSTKSFIDRSSDLRKSIQSKKPVNEEKLFVDVEAGMEYAVHLEYGTKHIKARRFMRDAAKKTLSNMTKAVKNSILRELRR